MGTYGLSKREIKYKYVYQGKIVDVGSVDFFVDGDIIVNGELVGGQLIQYTGLKDKNGKEIYEADHILDCMGVVYVVFYNKCKISLENISNKDIIDLTEEIASNSFIIGNAYENGKEVAG